MIDEDFLAAVEDNAARLLDSAEQDAAVPTMSLPTSAGIALLAGWDLSVLGAEIRRLWPIERAARQIDRANKICVGHLFSEYADKLDALHAALEAKDA